MRAYSVWLKDATKMIEVQADNVVVDSTSVDTANEGAQEFYWNFFLFAKDDDDENAVTVAAFPFANVEYIVSSSL